MTNRKDNDIKYKRNREILIRDVDDVCFLVDSEANIIFHLNILGRGVWNLLNEKITLPEIIETLLIAFPEAPPATIEKDVNKLISDMLTRNLIIEESE